MLPSSTSVAVPVKVMLVPEAKLEASGGAVMVTTGRASIVIVIVVLVVLPNESVAEAVMV